MKCTLSFLLGFALCAVSAFGQTESEIRNQIVGTWKLVSTEETMKDGTTRPFLSFGPHGKGFLMYQPDGFMCADIVNPDRPKWADPSHATLEEKTAAAAKAADKIVREHPYQAIGIAFGVGLLTGVPVMRSRRD